MSDYIIAKYVRLSRDDAYSDSLSIPNQKALLDNHIETLGISNSEVLEFVDNGFTGTNLERPALQEMLGLVQSGGVNCILVKDFSRFARNEIESSYYIEKIFPLYRIRFISVSDGFDSDDYNDSTGGMEVAFKFLLHEYYSYDLSRKVKSARRIKMKSGDNIVANAVYGYQKNMTTGKWEPDAEAAEVVRLIYRKALESMPVSQIRCILSAARYPTPQEYIKIKRGKEIVPEYAWESRAVINILENEQYIGSYVSGKYEQKKILSRNRILADKSEWIVIPDSHPPIISKEDFNAVQELLGRIKGARSEKPIDRLLNCENRPDRSRMAHGEKINPTPPYGYTRSCGEQWEQTEPTASRVREIFDMALCGLSCMEISKMLREAGYPTPSEHIKLMRGHDISPECLWSEGIVRRILKNAQYTGAYVSGKVRWDTETGKKYSMMESDWIVIPDKHPAIITQDAYDQVQERIRYGTERRKNTRPRDILFNGGILKCGCCGYGLRYSDVSNTHYYHCIHTISIPDAECHKMKVNACDLDNAVLTTIKKQAEIVLGSIDMSGFRKPNVETRQIDECESRIKELSEQRQDCYERFMCGEIDRDTFLSMKSDYTALIENLNTQASLYRQIGRDKEAQKKIAAFAAEAVSETATPKDIVNALVEKILVFPGNHLEIHWKFADFTENN